MKRIALLTVLLLVVGLAGFAIDVKPTLALTGSASVTWGYNLDTGSTGFLNAADASFTLSLLAADGTDTHAGTGAAYGSITINNIEFFWLDIGGALALDDGYGPDPTDGVSADITAKIVVTPFEIGVYAAPGMTQDFFGIFEDADVPDLVVDNNEKAFTMIGSGFAKDYGTWVTGTFGPVAVTLKVVSDGDWNKAGTAAVAAGADTYSLFLADGTETSDGTGDYVIMATGANAPAGALAAGTYYFKKTAGSAAVAATTQGDAYAFGGEAVLTISPLTVSAGGYYGSVGPSFYGKVALDMAPIVVWAAAEANLPTTGLALGLGGGLTFTLVADTTLAATLWYADAYNGLDLNVVFTEPGDKGLIPMLDTSITFNLLDVAGTLSPEWEVVTATGFKIGLNSDATNYVRPFVNFTYGSATNGSADADTASADYATPVTIMNATVGAQLQVIPLTLFTVEWVSGVRTLTAGVWGGADLISSPMGLGSIQFIATVTY